MKATIQQHAPTSALLAALRTTTDPLEQTIICDILGDRHARRAVPLLVAYIQADTLDVQIAAVDALAKMGRPGAGPPLLAVLQGGVADLRLARMVVAALGAVRYVPATPVLLPLTTSADASLRGTAVWALGALGAVAAVPRLRALLAVERAPYVVAQAQAALAILTAPPPCPGGSQDRPS